VSLQSTDAAQQQADANQEQADAKQEQAILANLNSSSAATAATLTSLQGITAAMNEALQKQLALFYDVSINVAYDVDKKLVVLTNDGRTNVAVWGQKFGTEPPDINANGTTIIPGGMTTNSQTASFNSLLTQIKVPHGQVFLIPFELYLKNEKGEEYVQRCNFIIFGEDDPRRIETQTISVTPEHWTSVAAPKVK
jgi:hypothetical protein